MADWVEQKRNLPWNYPITSAPLRHYSERHNINSLLDTPSTQLLLKGIRKSLGQQTPSATGATTSYLKRLTIILKKMLRRKEHLRFAAMMSLAFFGFLRQSEYWVTSAKHNVQWNRIMFGKQRGSLHLTLNSFKHSKGRGIVQIDKTKSVLSY